MKDIRHVFIVNPAAGTSNRARELFERISREAADARHEIFITEYPRHACLLVRQMAEKYAGERLRFYACGGDGTLNEVGTTAVGLKNCSFTHIPTGSGNDFIKIFGQNNLKRFGDISDMMRGDELELDYIESDCGVSLNVMSTGIDARIAWDMRKYKRIPGFTGRSAYMAAAIENILRGMFKAYRVDIEGEMLDGQYTLIMAANGRCYGSGFYIMPDSDPSDGLMDILLVKKMNRMTAISAINAYRAGKYRELPELIMHRRAREMTIFVDEARHMTLNLDGETDHTSRVSLRVAREKMRFSVPAGVDVLPPGER